MFVLVVVAYVLQWFSLIVQWAAVWFNIDLLIIDWLIDWLIDVWSCSVRRSSLNTRSDSDSLTSWSTSGNARCSTFRRNSTTVRKSRVPTPPTRTSARLNWTRIAKSSTHSDAKTKTSPVCSQVANYVPHLYKAVLNCFVYYRHFYNKCTTPIDRDDMPALASHIFSWVWKNMGHWNNVVLWDLCLGYASIEFLSCYWHYFVIVQ